MQGNGTGIDSGKIERIKQPSHIDDSEHFKRIMLLKEKYEKAVKETDRMLDENIE